MKSIYTLLHKKQYKNLLKFKAYRTTHKDVVALLQEYAIPCDKKEDAALLRYEVIYKSLLTKRQFEDVFFDTYVIMHDYWYDLTYLERKKQMNLEIDRFMDTLPSFQYKEQRVYMPCFDRTFNHLYTDEIVLLDLKQYHTFIRTCASEVKDHLYGANAYRNAFCSGDVLAEDEHGYVLYHPLNHCFYIYQDDVYQNCLALHHKQKDLDEKELAILAGVLLTHDEMMLINCLLQGSLIQDKMKRKIEKLKHKIEKKQQKKER